MRKKIVLATRIMSLFVLFAITSLLLANIVNAAVPISDGVDFPLGTPEGNGYGVECCGRLFFLEKWDYKKDGSLLS